MMFIVTIGHTNVNCEVQSASQVAKSTIIYHNCASVVGTWHCELLYNTWKS